jgi:hypothetical protein
LNSSDSISSGVNLRKERARVPRADERGMLGRADEQIAPSAVKGSDDGRVFWIGSVPFWS